MQSRLAKPREFKNRTSFVVAVLTQRCGSYLIVFSRAGLDENLNVTI